MAEAARALKANPKIAGQPCGWCSEALALGDEAKLCAECQSVHHARCWDGSAGCSKAGCVNAPLKQLDAGQLPAPPPVVPPGYVACPACRATVMDIDGLCPRCNAVLSADGVYHGEQVYAPGAVGALLWAIVGLFICGLICGPVAIGKSREASRAIAASPKYKGQALAITALVIGVVDIIGWVILLVMKMESR
jgi:hypothetical protein